MALNLYLYLCRPALAATASTLAAAGAAAAQNPSETFDAGLAAWAQIGDVAIVSVNDDKRAALTTAFSTAQDDDGLPAGALNLSGKDPAAAGLALETFVGLAAGALDLNASAQATEGSALRRTFQVTAGDRLGFDWQLATRDTGLALDYAFVVVDGMPLNLGTAASATSPGTAPYLGQTAFSHFDYTFQRSGLLQIAFGVVDVGDYSATSTLYLDGVTVMPATPVPEPSVYGLMFGGLGLIAGLHARRRSKQRRP